MDDFSDNESDLDKKVGELEDLDNALLRPHTPKKNLKKVEFKGIYLFSMCDRIIL